VVCAGRRFGKTFLALVIMLFAVCRPEARGLTIWYVAPTYRQAKEIAWKLLKRLIPPGWTQKINETDLSIEFKNGCVVALRGADNHDSLRGVGLDGLVLDEFADMGPDAWFEVLRPALADKNGWALFIGTPKGYNHFHEMWTKAHDASGWEAFQFTTADGGNVSSEELASAQAEMDERTFRQEFKASFESLAGRVYQAFERSIHVRSDLVDVPSLPLLIGMDFNVNPMSAILSVMMGGQLHTFGEIEIPNGNTELMVAEIRRRYPQRAIQVYPDPSGQARKTSAPVGQTDFSLIKGSGMRIIAPHQAPLVVDRVNEVNAVFRNAAGEVRAFVHPSCKVLIRGMEGLTWKEGTSAPDKSLGLDHMTDAFGYLVHSEFPLIKRTATSKEFRL
jgi:hypothetical protein